MRISLLAIGLALVAGGAMAHDPSGRPEAGNFAPHFMGTNGEGVPEVHRPAGSSHDVVSNGAAAVRGGIDDSTVTYSGSPQGNLGAPSVPRVVGNVDGRPIIEYGRPSTHAP